MICTYLIIYIYIVKIDFPYDTDLTNITKRSISAGDITWCYTDCTSLQINVAYKMIIICATLTPFLSSCTSCNVCNWLSCLLQICMQTVHVYSWNWFWLGMRNVFSCLLLLNTAVSTDADGQSVEPCRSPTSLHSHGEERSHWDQPQYEDSSHIWPVLWSHGYVSVLLGCGIAEYYVITWLWCAVEICNCVNINLQHILVCYCKWCLHSIISVVLSCVFSVVISECYVVSLAVVIHSCFFPCQFGFLHRVKIYLFTSLLFCLDSFAMHWD